MPLGQAFFQVGAAPAPVATTPPPRVGGGTFFPRYLNKTLLLSQMQRALLDEPPISSFFLFPNMHDLCLSRDYRMYTDIDPEALACAKKPECSLKMERSWVEPPPGWVTFNPSSAIALPAPAVGDTVIFSMIVPKGYDAIILGHYHGFNMAFDEGSGDLAWRISCDGRYLRDRGNMVLTYGSSRQLAPVDGGLYALSGNLIQYIVTAPNAGGSLPPPGTGKILAGLHGWFYPRK